MPPINRRDFVSHAPAFALAGFGLAALANRAGGATETPANAKLSAFGVFNVVDFGAKGDGTTMNTAAIQAAVDTCTAVGGGMVYVPNGRFLTGMITLKDNVTLHLSAGAVILGSTDTRDYPARPFPARDLDIGGFEIWALIYAANAKNISVEGLGTIDGQGKAFPPKAKIQPLNVASGPRPRGIFLNQCERVFLRDFLVHNAGLWAIHTARCDNVIIDGVTLFSEHYVQQDGIILDSSRNVRVSNCKINTVDDAVVFKSSFPQMCEHISITNCNITCQSSAIKFGTQSLGGFRDISISNCVCYDCRLGGLKFETVDGGILEDVTVSNIAMTNVSAPLFFKIGNRARDYGFKEVPQPQPIGKVRNIIITGLRATMTMTELLWQGGAVNPKERFSLPMRAANTMIIGGLPGNPVENVMISDTQILMPGGGTAEEAERLNIPEEEKRYPENDMFGILPAWGFYIRHARGVTLRNVQLDVVNPDRRTAILAEDVAQFDVSGFRASGSGSKNFIRLRDSQDVRIDNCRPKDQVETFVKVEGGASSNIAITGSDARNAQTLAGKGEGFSGEIVQVANLGAS